MPVVPFRADLVPAAREQNPSVVSECEDLLEKAKSGEIVGIVYATLHPGDLTNYGRSGRVIRAMLGALVLLQHAICKADLDE